MTKTIQAMCPSAWMLVLMTAVCPATEAEHLLEQIGTKDGVLVHLGCGDGQLLQRIAAETALVVHGLETDPQRVQAARDRLWDAGLYGRASVSASSGSRLPYADRLVNVLIVSHACGAPVAELERVLTPGGTLFSKTALDGSLIAQAEGMAWHVYRKAWPTTVGGWPQYQHGADGNAVVQDTEVGVPNRLQWCAGPPHSQHHNRDNSTTAMVSAGGRLFYTLNDAPPGAANMPGRWHLVARDAFNGVVLWKRPLDSWGWPAWADHPLPQDGFRGSRGIGGRFTQPVQVGRTLVATAERLYNTLGYGDVVSVLDARTGELLTTYADTAGCDELLLVDMVSAGPAKATREILLAAVHTHPVKEKMASVARGKPVPLEKVVVAIDVESGKTLWRSEPFVGIAAKRGIMDVHRHLNPVADATSVCLVTQDRIVCLDLRDGQVRWQADRPQFPEDKTRYDLRATDMVTLVCHGGKLFFAQLEPAKPIDWRHTQMTLHAYEMADGEHLWKHPASSWGWVAEPDVFVIDGLVWVADHGGTSFEGLAPETGEVRRRISTKQAFDQEHHHRCYRNKATPNLIITSFRGAEFFDVTGAADAEVRPWVRSVCRYGFMPANGLLYNAPDVCGCFPEIKLTGFNALAADPGGAAGIASAEARESIAPQQRLIRGDAFDFPLSPVDDAARPAGDWPMLRCDAQRSGITTAQAPRHMRTLWSRNVGGTPTSATVAEGMVFVGVPERFAVKALAADTGKVAWRFVAGSRVDSSPTYYRGMLLFGSTDGHVYCVQARDGTLRWRFRAAPHERLIAVEERLESAWPVHGSVVVQDGKVYVVAGRSTFLDGGFSAWVLDAASGRILAEQSLDDSTFDFLTLDASIALMRNWTLPGGNSDILVSDGAFLFMRQNKIFDLAGDAEAQPVRRLHTRAGFLNDSWFNRTSRWTWGAHLLGDYAVANEQEAYAFRLYPNNDFGDRGFYRPGSGTYALRAFRWAEQIEGTDRMGKPIAKPAPPAWTRSVPVTVRAMVKAADTLCVAGAPDRVNMDDPWKHHEGRGEGVVMTFDAASGEPIGTLPLTSAAVHHGLAAADGSLFVSCANGDIVRIDGKEK